MNPQTIWQWTIGGMWCSLTAHHQVIEASEDLAYSMQVEGGHPEIPLDIECPRCGTGIRVQFHPSGEFYTITEL